ncbi:hypothetical protein F4806DRAFT_502009 [Annulohypoxylon nitens]|nr:hypothetical protein F4806DRAFT_502009 [Annulohypoxylon nitens]
MASTGQTQDGQNYHGVKPTSSGTTSRTGPKISPLSEEDAEHYRKIIHNLERTIVLHRSRQTNRLIQQLVPVLMDLSDSIQSELDQLDSGVAELKEAIKKVQADTAKTTNASQAESISSRYLSRLVDSVKIAALGSSAGLLFTCLLSLGGHVEEPVPKILGEFVLYVLPLFLGIAIFDSIVFLGGLIKGRLNTDADK